MQAAARGDSEQLMPGLIFNRQKRTACFDPTSGRRVEGVRAGRMECTMQNIADFMTERYGYDGWVH